MNYWPLKDSEEGVVIVFSCLPTSESSKLQGIVPNAVSLLRPRLNSVGQKKMDMKVEKIFMWKIEV